MFWADSACIRGRAVARRVFTGSPYIRIVPRKSEGLPGFWAVLFVRAVVEDPAGCGPPLARSGEAAVAFRRNNALGTRNVVVFVAAWPTAHMLAHLRIAGCVTATGARLATDPGGLTPGRAGFAPAGRQTKFHEVIACFTPLRPALPGRTEPPTRRETVGLRTDEVFAGLEAAEAEAWRSLWAEVAAVVGSVR